VSLNRRLRRLEQLRHIHMTHSDDESPAERVAREQIEADIESIIVQHNLTPADVERIAAEIRAELGR
jgi:hypothetical protein